MVFAGLRAGESSPPADLVADDVLIMGPGPDDVAGRWRPLDGRRVGSTAATLVPAQIRVGLGQNAGSGWFWAFPGISAAGPIADGNLVERVSGVVSKRADGRWVVDHLYLSNALPNERLPEYQPGERRLAGIDDDIRDGAGVLVDLLRNNLGDSRLDLVARRDDVVVIGTDPNEVYETAAKYLDTFEPMREQAREMGRTSRFDFPDGTCARITDDGMTGFVATHIVATLGGMVMPTFRVSWVFTRVDGAFRLVCDHHGFPGLDPMQK